ncbi:MAG: alpha/beta fold hydrolase [Methylococcales bacterium]|nr:alpha/beta fold hydrolase [Methylococcales bacterium]MDD5754582.1 alpha/beta fold hydrolase [Methylococcales bacterium]
MQAIDLAFEQFGDTQNPPLIILHGFFAAARNWRACADKLAVQFCVYVLDARNHGASPHSEIMDYESMATDVAHFIEQHQLSAVNIMGHSMGGKTAMWFALNYPNLVQNLIVVDIAPIDYKHSFEPLINALKNLPLTELRSRKQAESLLADVISELSYRQFLLQNLVLKNDGQYQWRIDLDIFQHNAANILLFPNTENVPQFLGRTLFISGGNSRYIKENSTEMLFPFAQIRVIPDAEHWIHVQQPEAFLKTVTDFLQ